MLASCCRSRAAHRLLPVTAAAAATAARTLCHSPSSSPPLSQQLTHLGRTTEQPQSPSASTLERVPNAHVGTPYVARFVCPEFTSLCPVTAQPDFAHIVIDYVPDQWLLESKSLKLFMGSFRNHRDFHEACTVRIAKDIRHCVQPQWLRIGAYWYPRGGIPIDVFYASGPPPDGVWIPDQQCAPYRGRG